MSCCGSLFVNLGGGGGGTVNTGVLQIAGGVALDSTLRFVEDQNGTDSTLRLNTSQVQVVGNSDGSLPSIFRMIPATTVPTYGAFFTSNYDNNQWLTIGKGSSEYLKFGDDKIFTEKTIAIGSSTITTNGLLTIKASSGNIFSGRNSSNVEVSTITGAGNITGLDFLSANLTAGSLTTARVFRVGDKGTVTTENDLGLDAQIAVEHNGQVYYIPCSTVLLT
jgi:hypothetical protein